MRLSPILLPFLIAAVLALCCGPAPAQTRDGAEADWVEYRQAYRQMIWFEKYGKPKQFLQNHFRVRVRDKSAALDGVRLTLSGKSIQQNLALDPLGRAVFPFSKAAFDENAELTVNARAGQFQLGPWVSIVTRADGLYALADLRTACDQLLAYLRSAEQRWVAGKACVGVQFTYPRTDADAGLQLRRPGAAPAAIAWHEGPAFAGDAVTGFKVFAVRFAALPEAGQIVTRNTPLAIAALIE